MSNSTEDASSAVLRSCAYSGRQVPESEMVQLGEHWVAADCKDAAVELLMQGGVLEGAARATRHEILVGVGRVQLWALMLRSWELFRERWLLFSGWMMAVGFVREAINFKAASQLIFPHVV